MQVNILDAKNQLSQLVKRAQAGEEVIIAKRGQPVAQLVPAGQAHATTSARTGLSGIAAWLATHPLPAHARRDARELDAAIAQERQAWD